MSKSSKDLQANIQGESDLTRALRPGFTNMLRKGEGVGGGARPSVEKERSIGYEAAASKSPVKSPATGKAMFDQMML